MYSMSLKMLSSNYHDPTNFGTFKTDFKFWKESQNKKNNSSKDPLNTY